MVNWAHIEEIREGRHYKVNEQEKIIIYDPLENHVGQMDYTIHETIENMIEIAKREKNYEIQSNFNGGIFKINKDTTLEDGIKIAREAQHKYEEETKKQKLIENQKEEEETIQIQNKNDEDLIKDEILACIDAPSLVNQFKPGIKFAEHWGCLMQAEMKKQGLSSLTPEIVKSTDRRTVNYLKDNEVGYYNARSILIATWIHGEQLGHILGIPQENITEIRKEAILSNIKNKTAIKTQQSQNIDHQPNSNHKDKDKDKETKTNSNEPTLISKIRNIFSNSKQ